MAPTTSAPRRVIIATADTDVRGRFSVGIRNGGHLAVALESRQRLLEYMEHPSGSADLIILDLRLDGGGLDLARCVRRLRTAVPIVVFSGSVADAASVRSLSMIGIDTYVNEHSRVDQILPALAPTLFPDNFDRRTSTRITLAIPVSYRFADTIATALTLNLSRGGLGIRTMSPQETGTKVQVRFRLPDTPFDVEALCRVAWRDQRSGMGVQFEEVAPPAQATLDEYVDRYAFSR